MIGNIFPTQGQCKLCRGYPPNKILNERRIEIPMGSQDLYSFIGKPNIEIANQVPIQPSGDMWHISSYDSPKFNHMPSLNRKKRTRIFDTHVAKPEKKEIKQISQQSDLSQQVRLLKLQIKQYQRHEKLFAENERLLKSCNHSMNHKNQQFEHLSRQNKRLLSLRHSPNRQQIDDKFQQLLTPFAVNDDSFEVNQFRYSSSKSHATPKTVEPSAAHESPVQKVATFMKVGIPRIEEKNNELKRPVQLQIEPDQPIGKIKFLNKKLQLQCAILQNRSLLNVNPRKFLEHIHGDIDFIY